MQNYSISKTASNTFRFWTSSTALLWAAMAMLPAILYLVVIWATTANTPQGDDYVQTIFAVAHYLDAPTFTDKVQNTLWTYFQHRAVFSKILTLSTYFILGHIDLHIICFLGNLTLCLMVYMVARSIVQHRLPIYGMLIASLMILSFYSWSVAIWPICSVFYYSALLLAFTCFYLLDQPQPKIFAAAICSWLAAFTYANGLLSIVIGSLIVIFNQHNDKRYSSSQLLLWSSSVIGCLAVHFSTMNVFSTDLYGGKSVEDSFTDLSARAVDFLESMGAAPFFPNGNRAGKITLGCIILTAMAALLTSKKSFKSPAIIGLMLFSTGTTLLTSLFRYSAGENDGYQTFTAINMACMFIIGSSSISTRNSRIIAPLLLIMALAFNANAFIANVSKMQESRQTMTDHLEKFLLTGNSDLEEWSDVILYEGMARDIYRPLQLHQSLKIPTDVQTLDQCPSQNTQTKGSFTSSSTATAFAMQIAITLSPQHTSDDLALVLCGEKNYRLLLDSNNITINDSSNVKLEALIDKRQYDHSTYQAFLQNGASTITLTEPLTIPAIELNNKQSDDCNVMQKILSLKKVFQPFVTHYCQNNLPPIK